MYDSLGNISYEGAVKALDRLADKERAAVSQRFFKTGAGQYGEGDVFLGITVPVQRSVAKEFSSLPLGEVEKLLASKVHEHRFVALEILVMQYEKGDDKEKKRVVDFYLAHLDQVNNWDLVDTSAPYILGHYLFPRSKSVLYRLAKSKHLWRRRVAIIATLYFIGQQRYNETLEIAEILLKDSHDLIQKAVGWMLRELGKRSLATELKFLDTHAHEMPRTMLRYAIERLPETKRKYYLNK